MAIAEENTTTDVGGAGGSPITFSHTCTGSDLGLIVAVFTGGATAGTVSGITYDGVSMTQEATTSTSNRRAVIFSLINPSTGSNTVSIAYTGNGPEMTEVAVSYTGVDQTDMVEATNTDTYSSTSPSLSVTTVTNGAFVFVGECDNTNTDTTLDGSAVSRLASQQPSGPGVSSYAADILKVTAGAQSIAWTLTDSSAGPLVGVAIKPAVGAGPANVKSWNGVAIASIKSINGLAIADIKSINSLE